MFSRAKPVLIPDGLRYRAFLSYRSVDRKHAEWLHRKLETYRIPRRLVGKAGIHGPIPARLAPIFRDRDDARAANDLETIIAASLGQSQHLIVLCTPAAALPESWVGREIELFRRERPAGEVHAVIARGEPPACFPPPLLTAAGDGTLRVPLAADLRPPRLGGDGRKKAVVKLAAGLAGIAFDDLWRRERRRTVMRRSVAGLFAVGILLAGGVWLGQRESARLAAIAQASGQVDRDLYPGATDLMLIAAGPPVWGAAIAPDPRQAEDVRAIARRFEPSFAGFAAVLHVGYGADKLKVSEDRRFVHTGGGPQGIFVWDVPRNRLAARLPISKSDWLQLPRPYGTNEQQMPIALDVARDGRSVLAVYAHGKSNERIVAWWKLDENGGCRAPCLPDTFRFTLPEGAPDWSNRISFEDAAQLRLFPNGRQALYVEKTVPVQTIDLTRRTAIPIVQSRPGKCLVEIPWADPPPPPPAELDPMSTALYETAGFDTALDTDQAHSTTSTGGFESASVTFADFGTFAGRHRDDRTVVFYSGPDAREMAGVRVPKVYFPSVFLGDGHRVLMVNVERDVAGVLDLRGCRFDAWPAASFTSLVDERMLAVLGDGWQLHRVGQFLAAPDGRHVAGLISLSTGHGYYSVVAIYGIEERRIIALTAPFLQDASLQDIKSIAVGGPEFPFLLLTYQAVLPVRADGSTGSMIRYGDEQERPWLENTGQPVLTRMVDHTSQRNRLRVIDRRTGRPGPALDFAGGGIASAAVSDDGKILAVAQDHFITLQPANARAIAEAQRFPFEGARSVLLSPDGRWLAVSTESENGPGVMQVWEIARRRIVGRREVPEYSRLRTVRNDGSVLFSTWDVLMHLDVRAGKSRVILEGKGLGLARNGAHVLIADSGGRLWDLDANSNVKAVKARPFLKEKFLGALSPDGRTAYASKWGAEFFLDVGTGASKQFLGQASTGLATFARNGHFAIVVGPRGENKIQLWDPVANRLLSTYTSDWEQPVAIWFSQDGLALWALDDRGRFHRWSLISDYAADVAAACVSLRDSGARMELTDDELAREPLLSSADKAPCLRVGPLNAGYYDGAVRRAVGMATGRPAADAPSDCAKGKNPADVKRCMEPFEKRWRQLEKLAKNRCRLPDVAQ